MTSAPSSTSPVAVNPSFLVAATPLSSYPRYPPAEQAIPPTPQAPKKIRLATSSAAILSPIQFNMGGTSESKWLRFNHRVDPKKHNAKASSDKPRRAVKRSADEMNFHLQMTSSRMKQNTRDIDAQYWSALCKRLTTDEDEKDTSSSKNV